MRHHTLPLVIASIVMLVSLSSWTALAQTTPCQIGPVFLMLRDLVGRERVGECTGPMVRDEAGNLTQITTRGVMTLRTADQVPAFSDGQTTWLYGPNGLESRPSGGRLPWETTTGNIGVASTATPTPTAIPTPTATPWSQYGATSPQYGTTVPQYGTTSPQYGATAPQYGSTSPQYGSTAPQYGATAPQYGTTSPQSGATSPQYGATAPQTSTSLQQAAPPPAPSPVASPMILTPTDLPITLSGDDSTSSQPVDLAGGDYAVHWDIQLEHGKTSCYVGSRLRHPDDDNPGSLVMHTTMGAGTSKDRSSSGDTRLFSVVPGRYVVDVMTTGCTWKLSIQAP